MAKVKVRVKIDHVVSFESEDYRDEWVEECEQGEFDSAEAAAVAAEGDIPADFAISMWSREVEDGVVDIAEILEDAAVQIEPVA